MELAINPAGKGTLKGAVAYAESHISQCHWVVSIVDRSEQPPVPEGCVRDGWRSIAFGQSVRLFGFDSAFPAFTGSYRGIGQLIARLTYADALSKEETSNLIEKNEESFRLSTEAFSRVYLVNIIPMRTLISMPI